MPITWGMVGPRPITASTGTWVWDPNNANTNGSITLSNGNRTATDGTLFQTYRIAIDVGTKSIWYFDPNLNQWNGTNNGDPVAEVDAYTWSFSGSICPAFAAYGSTAANTVQFNLGASAFLAPIPTGYVSWNALAGSTSNFNPAATGSKFVLSGSNLIASVPAATPTGWNTAQTNNFVSTGKGYLEATLTSYDSGTNGWELGICTASEAFNSQYLGGDAFGAGVIANGTAYNWATTSGSAAYHAANSSNSFWKLVRASGGFSSGKYYWEVSVNSLVSQNIVIGVMDGTENPYTLTGTNGYYPGATSHGYGWQQGAGTGTVWHNSLSAGSFPALTAAGTVGVALDTVNSKIWFWNSSSGQWNGAALGSQNPATNTGGISISGLTAPYFPAVALYGYSSQDQITANTNGITFAGGVPGGFTAL